MTSISIVELTLTIYTTYISIDSTFKSVIWNAMGQNVESFKSI